MTELNDLFEQIFHSERNFKERADQLKALNTRIQDAQLELEQSREMLASKQGELVVKNSKLADTEMEVKLLEVRKSILQSQKKDIINEKNMILEKYQDMVKALDTEKQLFLERLKEFSRCYDLHGSGLKHREEEDRKKTAVLQDELILLETELVEIESYFDDIKQLQVKLANAEGALKQEKAREEDLKAKLLQQEAEIQKLKREKLTNSNNPELNRLQCELDACKNSHEEEQCKELSKELEELQKECYHKQMKLQTARQSRKNAPQIESTRRTQQHYTQRPQASNYSETFPESGDDELVDDEWFEAGMLDSNDEGQDDNELEEYIWGDIDETELEQDVPDDIMDVDRSVVPQSIPNRRTPTSPPPPAPVSGQAKRTFSRADSRKLPVSSLEVNRSRPEYSLASPCPSSIPRKRPGESIFKAPKAQASSGTKTTKRVRFHY